MANSPQASALRHFKQLPDYVRKASRVGVQLVAIHDRAFDNPQPAHFDHFAMLFYALITLLATGNVQALNVQLHLKIADRLLHVVSVETFSADTAKTLLYPISLLPSKIEVNVLSVDLSVQHDLNMVRQHHDKVRLDLVEWVDYVDDINALVKRTGVAPNGIRCLVETISDTESGAIADVKKPLNYAHFAAGMKLVRLHLQQPQVRRLVEKAREIEAQDGIPDDTG